MFGRNFAGRGRRGGMGFGFRGSSPPWPYVGLGRGGLPRCGYFSRGVFAPPYWPSPQARGYPASGEDELGHLNDRARAIKEELDAIESRMRGLEDKG